MERTTVATLPLHSSRLLRRRYFNRAFALIYAFAITALLLRHTKTLLNSLTNFPSFLTTLSFLISDIILTFMWINSQAFRMNPLVTEPFPENLEKVFKEEDFPALDVFICTADPDKEPPMRVATTALSVMAYDYPPEKLSIYLSDDGGSELTLFALMEAAEFGKVWLPFCKENKIMERCPDAYFSKNFASNSQSHEKIKEMYDNMKTRVGNVVERGSIDDEYKKCYEEAAQVFGNWTQGFSRQHHPAIIQVLLQSSEHRDLAGCFMPNLIYVSREKSRASPHYFKAGALNALLRVSGIMTNAPIILTLDCDMISNDPSTPMKMLCYFMEQSILPDLAYVQFPVLCDGLNEADIYGSELKRPFQINPVGFNGLNGPDYFGTGTFFSRRAFHGDPASIIEQEIPELSPDYVVQKPIDDQAILKLAHHTAGCNFESHSNWGSKIGFRYGSLVEDYYTGYRLHCEGWKSIFCNPRRPAFLSEMPISLNEVITQMKRWNVGLLEVAFSKHSTLTFGRKYIGLLKAHCYSYYAFGPIWSIPIMVYAFLPQTTMLSSIYIFPKVTDPWFFLYMFLFLGAYGQDCVEFILAQGTFIRWWNDQRMWLIRGLSSDLFGALEYISNHLGIASRGFDVTNKSIDSALRKRYDEGKFEFGVPSPMFLPLSMAAILNLVAFAKGFSQFLMGRDFDDFFGQLLITSFGVVNCWPVYEAMVLRTDEGRMPTKITIISVLLAWVFCAAISFLWNI